MYTHSMKLRLLATTLVLVCACAHDTKSTASQGPVVSGQEPAGSANESPTSSTSMGEARPDGVADARSEMDVGRAATSAAGWYLKSRWL